MKAQSTLRARCLYSKAVQFIANQLYTFELLKRFTYYDLYLTVDNLCAFRFLGDSTRALLIEDANDIVAVFEVILECTK